MAGSGRVSGRDSAAHRRHVFRRELHCRSMRRVILALAVASALTLISCTAPNRGPVAPHPARDNTTGPANASVTIDEWADFQCPACRNFAALQPGLDQAILRDGRARFVFHHMAFL